MEVEVEGNIPFLGIKIMKTEDGRLETEVCNKPTNTGLLLHYIIAMLIRDINDRS